jgi:glycosyltransferase involved in cell wall biosynthesis
MCRIVMAVINDLVTDQRVHKVCSTLSAMHHSIILIGRETPGSLPLMEKPWKQKRLSVFFNKNILKFAEANFRLFFSMLRLHADIIYANDLDVLPACTLVAVLRNKKLVYDSHEFFTGVPELKEGGIKQKIWALIERTCLPKTDLRFTVNKSIADLLEESYGHPFEYIRNLPFKSNYSELDCLSVRQKWNIPSESFVLILQGNGINVQRGGEELLEAFMQLPDNFFLVIAGSGDVIHQLKEIAKDEKICRRVLFTGRLAYSEMMGITAAANLGLSLDKGYSLNYKLSLPNKLFDYIQAGIPVLATDLIEIRNIITRYKVGKIIPNPFNVAALVSSILELYGSPELMIDMQKNASNAGQELCWENESKKLEDGFYNLSKDVGCN